MNLYNPPGAPPPPAPPQGPTTSFGAQGSAFGSPPAGGGSGSYGEGAFTSNIAADIVLSLITCGIYMLFIQNRQIQATNYLLGNARYDFAKWILLTLVTCGIYHVYYQYMMAKDVCTLTGEPASNEPLVCLVVTLVGLTIIADAIIQARLNRRFGRAPV